MTQQSGIHVPISATALCLAILASASPLSAQAHPQRVVPGLDAAGLDTTVRPGDDFYRYANGTWERRTQIAGDQSAFGAFNIAAKLADAHLTDIVHQAAASHASPGSDLRKIADYYHSYLDTAAIATRGSAPLRPVLDSIAAIGDRTALARFLGAHLRADVDPINNGTLYTDNPFGLWVERDFNHPDRNVASLLQGGLGMPDRSYYLDQSPRMSQLRDTYRAHVARMLTLAGVDGAGAKADSILALETKIAGVHWKVEDSEDPAKGNNHWARTDFGSRAPGMDWDAFFSTAGLAHEDSIIAWQPSAIVGIAALVGSEPIGAWKALLASHAIEDHAAVLPPAFDRESFGFFGKTLSGTPEQEARDRRAIAATSDALGFAVGRLYARRYFPASAKARTQTMVAGLKRAFERRIDALPWMAPSTKAEAKAKLATLRVSVGYPDKWPSYGALRVVSGDAYGNVDRTVHFVYEESIAKLREPVDRSEWVMTPQTVNAVNLPAINALNFPAAILLPPFFDAKRADAMNYGAIGAVIGHEISHSFDNNGATFDSKGRMRNWWTPEDFAHFQASTHALALQYNTYRPFADDSINGQQTLAENIADLAGLTAAYDAFHASLHGKRAPVVGGLTGDQQLFLSWAQIWRTKYREAALRRSLVTGTHSPGPWRALTVRNLDPWYGAFAVTPGEKLYLAPGERVRIW